MNWKTCCAKVGCLVVMFCLNGILSVQAQDSGVPGAKITPYELPFPAADAVFDPVRPRAYFTDFDAKTLIVLNLTNGLIDRQFNLSFNPETLTISPNGQRLYVALLKRQHSPYWFGGHSSYIVEFDLTKLLKTAEYEVNMDPYDMVVTDQGVLAVTSGSDQWTELRTIRAHTGEQLGTYLIRQASRISLHPSQKAVYTADTDSFPSDIRRYDFNPTTGVIASSWDSPYHGDYPMNGNVWCHPNGTNLVVRGGGVYTSSPNQEQDMRFVANLDAGSVEAAAFDTAHKALFTLAAEKLSYYNLSTFQKVSTQDAGPANYIHVSSNLIYLASVSPLYTLIERMDNPAVGAETNRAPIASFTRVPTNATTRFPILFDASSSTDDQTVGVALEYRWDWDNDGVFDTAYTNSAVASFQYNIAGTKTARLEVKDRYGAVSSATQTFNVALEYDPGSPGGDNPAFELLFTAADVAFDPQRPYAYVTGYDQKTLIFLNLTNGLVEKEFKFAYNPESITISPNGQRMYVALLKRPHSPYWFGGHTSYIAEFDLTAQAKIKEFQILMDPYDLAVTDGGILIVTSGSDQWTDIRTFRTSTGAQLGTSNIRERSRISLHPDQNAVYTADTDLSPSDIQRYEFNKTTGEFVGFWDSPYHGDYPMSGNVWCHPYGTNIIVRGGGVFTSSTTATADLRYLQSLEGGPIDELIFDAKHNAFFTSFGNILRYYNLNTMELVKSLTTTNSPKFLNATEDSLYLVALAGNRTTFSRRKNPAQGAESNQAPIASFSISPTKITTLTSITLDASASTDDQDNASTLEYRWDWDSDGNYDTGYSNNPIRTVRFTIAGTKNVKLQVRDSFGLVSTLTKTINVLQENDPGSPGEGGPAFEVQFPAADIAFDPIRPRAYVTGYQSKKLAVINLTNGITERLFTFEWFPESITISPNGQRMYVALLKRDHSPYWFGGHSSVIAEFDLTKMEKTTDYEINMDPYDMVVTDQGVLLITNGSDQWTEIRSVKASTGEQLGTYPIRHMSRISLHPSQKAVYTADTDLSPSDIRRFDFNPTTGAFISSWDSRYHGDYPMSGKVWCTPNGGSVLVRGGGVFSSSASQSLDMIYTTGLGAALEDVGFDTIHRGIFTVADSNLSIYSLDNFLPIGTKKLLPSSRYVSPSEREVYVAAVNTTNTFFQRFRNPLLPEPFVLEQPQDQTVVSGNAVLMKAVITGAQPLAYQWFFENKSLPNQTNVSLIWTSAAPSDQGSYFVIASNAYGSTTSTVAQLEVLIPPFITKQPTGGSVPAGAATKLEVSADGTGPLRYQWLYQQRPIPKATNATLQIPNAQLAQDGVYQVQISNAAGNILSDIASIRVLPNAPQFIATLENQTVNAGDFAQFVPTFTGSMPSSYQWYFNGAPLAAGTNATLLISNAQIGDAGSYHLAIANYLGKATSAPASLAITPSAPRFTLQPNSYVRTAGSSNVLVAKVVGTDPITYQWQFHGTNLPGALSPTLIFTSAVVADSGPYVLIAQNALGYATSSVANLIITGAPPIIVQHPLSTTVFHGKALALESKAAGSPTLRYQWYLNNSILTGATNASLAYSKVTMEQKGEYYVVVSNEFGQQTSSKASVDVWFPPQFLTDTTNVAVTVGKDVRLSVDVDGASPLQYTWQFREQILTGAVQSSLLITNVQPAQAGVYRLTVNNNLGVVSSLITLTVLPKPGNLVAWGDDTAGQSTIPTPLSDIIGAAGGDFHSLALRSDGTVYGWGYDEDGQASPPSDLEGVIAIAAGGSHSLALKLNGSVVAWGRNDYGQTTLPPETGSIVAIAAGHAHNLVLRQDGVALAWGDNTYNQVAPAEYIGYVVGIAAGRAHSVTLSREGRVACWGLNTSGQTSVPAGLRNVRAIAAGYLHTLALRSNGTVVVWGDNSYGQLNVPSGLNNVVAISAGHFHSYALRSDGTIVAWGDNSYGQLQIPSSPQTAGLVTSGYYHGLALMQSALKYQMYPGGFVLTWPENQVLQHSVHLMGPYEDLQQSGPYTNQMKSAPTGFFRLRTAP